MGMLPNLVPDLQEQVDNITTAATTTSMGKSFFFDFATGDFVVRDGKVVKLEGLEALNIWIEKVLRTKKDKFKIYDEIAYGISTHNLLNKGYHMAFIQSEIMREIMEVLLKNTEINSVTDFTFTRNKRGLVVFFTVNSLYGVTQREVII